jgi:hypothetical protein
MSSETIYSILSSKPHNPHYLNRYWKFIQYCQKHNLSSIDNTPLEEHHVCPKAKDLFPEYSSFKKNEWNLITLTCRQHILAHVLLWKTYGGSQTFALDYMINRGNNSYGNPRSSRKTPPSIIIRYSAKLKELSILEEKGFATYKDSSGNKYYLHKNDPLIKEFKLVGNNKGMLHDENSKKKMSRAKFLNKKIKLYFLNCKISVKLFSDEFHNYISQGWSTTKTEDDKKYISVLQSEKVSKKLTGKVNYMTPDGIYFGKLLRTDPLIKELNLLPHLTDKMINQRSSRSKLASAANTGSQIYNNGVKEKKFKDEVPDGWVKGRLPRSKEYDNNHKNATAKAHKNTYCWNNGIKCIKLPASEHPGDGWAKGMLPRKSKNKKRTKNK